MILIILCDHRITIKHYILIFLKIIFVQICPKKFRQAGDLKKHMTIHTKEKNYPCQYCDKRFTRRSNSREHERRHGNWLSGNGESCPICNNAHLFKRLDLLKRHMLSLHAGTEEEQRITARLRLQLYQGYIGDLRPQFYQEVHNSNRFSLFQVKCVVLVWNGL